MGLDPLATYIFGKFLYYQNSDFLEERKKLAELARSRIQKLYFERLNFLLANLTFSDLDFFLNCTIS